MVVSPSRITAVGLRALPRRRLSRMLGRLADLEEPQVMVQQAIDAFVRVYRVDLSEAVIPEGGYPTFDAFFTRRLVEGSRPIATDRELLVSPADGRIEDVGAIDRGTFRVKGRFYTVADLLDDRDAASRFQGGSVAVVYLSPPDYHRVHAPVDGDVERLTYTAGTLYPVNAIGAHVPRLLVRNERVAVHQRSRDHEVVTVLVGAIGVGRIGLAFDDLLTNTRGLEKGRQRNFRTGECSLTRGDELGAFHLGSTVVVLTSAPVDFPRRGGDFVRMGQPLARWASGGGS